MRLFLLLCLTLLSPQVVTFRHYRPWDRKKAREPSVVATVPPHSRDFAFDLYRALASAAPGQNVFFSPVSVSMSLAMLSLGTGTNTKAQILEGLGLSSLYSTEEELHKGFQKLLQELCQPQGDFQLSLGNALFVDPAHGILDTFLRAIRTLYLADTLSTSFKDPSGAQKQINDYVAKQSQGKIVDLIQNLDSTHIMVVVNYIFFKAKWETAFSHRNTLEQDFHVTPEKTVRVPMMSRDDLYYYFLDRNLSAKVVAIPYQGNATAIFILPDEGKMEQVENGLSERRLRKWFQMLSKRRLVIYLPKFSIEGSYHLEKILPKLGITDVFTSQADLSGISNHSNIQVSEMVHKAVVEVDEAGTRAAAATGTVFAFRSAQLSPQRIVFNKSFLMCIMENMNILFLGRVTNP
ncbi:plasma serine protease inhibitor-like [Ctenodactylus gundi]